MYKRTVQLRTEWYYIYTAYAASAGGLVGDPRAYQDRFRGFESHRVHARTAVWFFSCVKVDWRKARERELAILRVRLESKSDDSN